MEIVLYLMNQKGVNTLEALSATFTSKIIKAVISSRDKNVQNDYYDEIKSFCKKNAIYFMDRTNDNGDFNEEYRIAIGWRWIIPSSHKLIVFHDSLLPKYRGFAPLVNSLINGEKEIGVTALFASDNYDKGDIINQKSISISYPIRIEKAISKITPLYQELAIEIVKKLLDDTLISFPQDESKATYSIWRDEEDYHVNWNDTAENIVNFIDAVSYPYLGAYSYIDNEKVRIIEAEVYDHLNLELCHFGKVMLIENTFPIIITANGLVKITKLRNLEDEDILPSIKFRTRFK